MTKGKGKAELIDVKELLERDEDFLQAALQALLQAALEAEMTEAIGAEKGERTETRLAYRSGYYPRSWVTRVGTLELRVPQDRGRALFDRAVPALPAFGEGAGRHAGGDVRAGRVDPQGQGGNRGVVRPQLLGLGNQRDQQVAGRGSAGLCRTAADEDFPYLILDARYEKVREAGIILSQAVLVAVAVDGEGRRQILGVDLANRESRTSWRDFLRG